MFKKELSYENYDGQTVTETYYFNLSKAELVRLDLQYHPKGFAKTLVSTIQKNEYEEVMEFLEKFIKLSYGVRIKDEETTYFRKPPAAFDKFRYSGAFDQLIFEMFTDTDFMTAFLAGVMPTEIQKIAESKGLKTDEFVEKIQSGDIDEDNFDAAIDWYNRREEVEEPPVIKNTAAPVVSNNDEDLEELRRKLSAYEEEDRNKNESSDNA